MSDTADLILAIRESTLALLATLTALTPDNASRERMLRIQKAYLRGRSAIFEDARSPDTSLEKLDVLYSQVSSMLPLTACKNGECPCGYLFTGDGEAYIGRIYGGLDSCEVDPVIGEENRLNLVQWLLAVSKAWPEIRDKLGQSLGTDEPDAMEPRR